MAALDQHDAEVSGLDALELAPAPGARRLGRLWASAWPRFAAIAIALAVWQLIVWTGWRPRYAFPDPLSVGRALGGIIGRGELGAAVATTILRALAGYAFAIVIGTAIGLAVSRVKPLRAAVGSLITGLQTMPSIAWFPLAIVLFKLSESAILFVVVLGAAPAIANGVLNGVDHIPPLLLRAGRVAGARGVAAYRHVIIPAGLPGYVAGLKQGWAFAWRSLMAGELLVVIAKRPSVGTRLQFSRELSDAAGVVAWMLVILVLGILVDMVFSGIDRRIRERRGLVEAS